MKVVDTFPVHCDEAFIEVSIIQWDSGMCHSLIYIQPKNQELGTCESHLMHRLAYPETLDNVRAQLNAFTAVIKEQGLRGASAGFDIMQSMSERDG